MKKWSSYSVASPSDIVHSSSNPMGGDRKSPTVHLTKRYLMPS